VSDRKRERFERCLRFVMIVFAPQDINVDRRAHGCGERGYEVRNVFTRELSEAIASEVKRNEGVTTT
jgi:hypothetical protein